MKLWDRILATVTAVGLVAGGLWTVCTYFSHQKEELSQKRQEYFLTQRKEKRELFQPLCTAAARIATAKTMRDAEPDVAVFWQLYWGQVHFISDKGFQEAKERFRDELVECLERSDQPASGELRNRSHELAMAVQQAIKLETAYGLDGQHEGGATVSDEFWKAVATLAWPAILVVVLILIRKDVRLIVRHIVWRIKAGAAIKLASFEVSAPFVSHDEKRDRVRGVAAILDDTDEEFAKSREVFKTTNRNLFLVHRVVPSKDESQLYDIMIYLVPSLKYGSLEGVLSVEYYFGKYWGSKVFKSIDRASGFSIATSAWAPFSCTARIRFSDGQSVFLHRYIDFEMGAVGNIPFRRDET